MARGCQEPFYTGWSSAPQLRSVKKARRSIWVLHSPTVKAHKEGFGSCPAVYVKAGISELKYYRRQIWLGG